MDLYLLKYSVSKAVLTESKKMIVQFTLKADDNSQKLDMI